MSRGDRSGGLSFAVRAAMKAFTPGWALPEVVVAFVTRACPLVCRHCFYWRELNRRSEELTPGEWARVAATLGKPAMIVLTGGEPFARRDFAEVAWAVAKARPNVLGIVTAGYHPERIQKQVRELLEHLPETQRVAIAVSIDGPEPIHDLHRGRTGSYRRAVATLEGLHALRRQWPNLATEVCVAYDATTAPTIEAFVDDILERLGPTTVSVALVRGDARHPEEKRVDLDHYRQVLAKIHSRSLLAGHAPGGALGRRLGAALNRWKTETIARVAAGNYPMACAAGTLAGAITPDGDVLPCEQREDSFGNLREHDYDFARLWRSGAKRRFRRQIRRERCRCTHEIWYTPALAYRPLYWPRLLWEAVREPQTSTSIDGDGVGTPPFEAEESQPVVVTDE